MQQELLRLPSVLARVGWGRSTLYMKIRTGEFPSPVQLGPRAVAWVGSEVGEWIARRITESRAAPKGGGQITRNGSSRACWRPVEVEGEDKG
jgi:prophage regulatory protein